MEYGTDDVIMGRMKSKFLDNEFGNSRVNVERKYAFDEFGCLLYRGCTFVLFIMMREC